VTDNTSGNKPAGADARVAPKPEQGGKLEGAIEVSVDLGTKQVAACSTHSTPQFAFAQA
jgi:hypothetical protein